MVQYGGSGVAKREEGGKSSDVTLHEGKFMDEVTHKKVLRLIPIMSIYEKLIYKHEIRANTNQADRRLCFKIPNWLEADQVAAYKAQHRSWTRGNREQINTRLNLEPPDFKSSALSDLARRSKIVYLLPLISFPFLFFVSSLNVRYVVNLFSCPGWFSCIITNLHEGPTWPVVTFTDTTHP